jgi:hypothetical protein
VRTARQALEHGDRLSVIGWLAENFAINRDGRIGRQYGAQRLAPLQQQVEGKRAFFLGNARSRRRSGAAIRGDAGFSKRGKSCSGCFSSNRTIWQSSQTGKKLLNKQNSDPVVRVVLGD